MKKIILAITIIMMSAVTVVSAKFENPPVSDNGGLLSQQQLAEISQSLEQLREEYGFDTAIYTEETLAGDDAQSRADDIFDYGGYGRDGILLYISVNPRKYHITTHGRGEAVFNENGLAYIEKMILPSLRENDSYTAMKLYAAHCGELLEMARQGNPFNKSQHSMQYIIAVLAAALLLPVLAAYLITAARLAKMKTANKQDYAANYMKPGSLKLENSQDLFLYSTVTKTPKPKSDSGSHVSSSGESHGGRGGSY
ncbi:MAG: TPM domain-containing protein [Clostridiales bacterium]|nr:TPM domain-containing protein [Clostridiales bacterium]